MAKKIIFEERPGGDIRNFYSFQEVNWDIIKRNVIGGTLSKAQAYDCIGVVLEAAFYGRVCGISGPGAMWADGARAQALKNWRQSKGQSAAAAKNGDSIKAFIPAPESDPIPDGVESEFKNRGDLVGECRQDEYRMQTKPCHVPDIPGKNGPISFRGISSQNKEDDFLPF